MLTGKQSLKGLALRTPTGCGIVFGPEGSMSKSYKSEIEWRSDISGAPRNRRILMIATSVVPNQIKEPEIFVAHWHGGSQGWVIADTVGEPRRQPRLDLNCLYWAELGELPPGIVLRRLDLRDFNG
jgi:hypothetical protein